VRRHAGRHAGRHASRHAGFLLAFLVLVAVGLWGGNIGVPGFVVPLGITALFWIAQATSWNLLSGFSGYFSFGQAAYVGTGAYAVAVLTGRHGVSLVWSVLAGAALSGLLALAIGAVAFRLRSLRGEIFALLTLAVPFILAAVASINRTIDGGQGTTIPLPSVPGWIDGFPQLLFVLDAVVAIGALATACAVQHGRLGWGLSAIRDAEDVAEGIGVGTLAYKMWAILLSGLIGGLSGALYALQIGFVTVEGVFGLTIPLLVIVMSVLGGRTHWLGPAIGALLIVTLQDRLSASGYTDWNPIVLGAVLAVLVVVAPNGLYGRMRARPWAVLGALVVPIVAGYYIPYGDLQNWVLAGMLLASLVAVVPARWLPARLTRPPQPEPVPAVDRPTPPEPGPPGETVIECRSVARYYGGVHALEDVSLTVAGGELVGLVGPNGSGKTTLVNLLAGSVRPSRGTVAIAGQDTARLVPHRIAHAGVARTYQIPRPFDSMTVRDNVAMAGMFGRRGLPLTQARAEAGAHLETVSLDRLADAYPGSLNLHQRQLLEMARAVASEPRVLLLDEAMAGLNPAEIDEAVEVIRRISAAGVTIVLVEHLLRVLNQLATRLVVLDRGRLLADGEPQAVLSDPAVVRAYLGRQTRV
jgi:branched-chain amino acid transport system permease protein